MRRTNASFVTAVAVAAMLAPLPAGAALGDSRCSYNRSSRVLTVRAGTDVAHIARDADGSILLNEELCTFVDSQDRVLAVTVRNTASIVFRRHPEGGQAVAAVDLRGGHLVPGFGAEAGSSAEIEMSVASDIQEFRVIGRSTADTIVVGADGINLNASEGTGVDADVTFAAAGAVLSFSLGSGIDSLTGAGGAGTGAIATRALVVRGGGAADVIQGGNGADTLSGEAAGDSVRGGGGGDTFLSEPGDDSLDGEGGQDTFYQGAVADGADTIDGGAHRDTLMYATPTVANPTDPFTERAAAVQVVLNGDPDDGQISPPENDSVNTDVEHVIGGDGGDVLTGDGGNDSFDGGAGADTITGGLGADNLNGGSGVDVIHAQDDVVDQVQGGDAYNPTPGFPPPAETDVCNVDSGATVDVVTSCETINDET